MNQKQYYLDRQTKVKNQLETILEELKLSGYSILPNLYSKEEVDDMNARLENIYKRQVDELPDGLDLPSINDENVIRMPSFYDDLFVETIKHPGIMEIVQHMLGDYFILYSQNCGNSYPGEPYSQAYWHRDLLYQDIISSNKPLGITTITCLDPFSMQNGSTSVLPYSHKFLQLPSDQYIEQNETTIEANAGDVILFNSHMFHKGGYNRSEVMRRGLIQIYVVPNFRQQYNTAQFFKGRFSDDATLRMLFAYDLEHANSVLEWRKERKGKNRNEQ